VEHGILEIALPSSLFKPGSKFRQIMSITAYRYLGYVPLDFGVGGWNTKIEIAPFKNWNAD